MQNTTTCSLSKRHKTLGLCPNTQPVFLVRNFRFAKTSYARRIYLCGSLKTGQKLLSKCNYHCIFRKTICIAQSLLPRGEGVELQAKRMRGYFRLILRYFPSSVTYVTSFPPRRKAKPFRQAYACHLHFQGRLLMTILYLT